MGLNGLAQMFLQMLVLTYKLRQYQVDHLLQHLSQDNLVEMEQLVRLMEQDCLGTLR